jgi:hypothetical protein
MPNKRVESDSLRRRFAPPPLAAHARRSAAQGRAACSREAWGSESRSEGMSIKGVTRAEDSVPGVIS